MNAPEFALHWAHELGSTSESLLQLRGGINNLTFRCGAAGLYCVLKGYPTQKVGQRDRMLAEIEFLRYAAEVAPDRVPKLMHVDPDRRCVVLEHIEGHAYREGASPTQKDVQAAKDFFWELNSDLKFAKNMIHMQAAEGFLSLRAHMSNMHDRLAAMGTDHLPNDTRSQAELMLKKIRDQAHRAQAWLEKKISSGVVEDALDPNHRCISPSDFGFHNAICTEEGVRFIDFEFAGWDDPAKTFADFALQPRLQIQNSITSLSILLNQKEIRFDFERYKCLGAILQVKWSCIILGLMNPKRMEEMVKIDPNVGSSEFITKKVEAANQYMKTYRGFRTDFDRQSVN